MLAAFRALGPDEGAGNGAAVADAPGAESGGEGSGESPDSWATLVGDGDGSFLDDQSEVPFPGVEDEGEGGEGEGAEGEGTPPAVPESLDVDGAPVPVADLLAAYKDGQANAETLKNGQIYMGAMEAFNSGPEGARAVIETMLKSAREVYGDDAFAGLAAPEKLPEGFREEDLTENERAIYLYSKGLERKLADQTAEFQRTLDEFKPVIADRKLTEAAQGYATTVNAQFPNANVDAKTIVAMMKETGLDDPVKAYKLATYDTKAAESAKPAEEGKKSTMPRQGVSEKTFDPTDPSLTADRMIWLLENGHKPIKA